MTNIIRIKNAIFFAYHGLMQEEQNLGGKFNIDVDMYTDFSNTAKSDNLTDTINYVMVYKEINKIIHEKNYNLIETIATHIADELLKQHPAIQKIAVRVRKNSVPIGGVIDYVEAEVIKENE